MVFSRTYASADNCRVNLYFEWIILFIVVIKKCKIDAFGGNSGSPLFNKKGNIVGILCEGNKDYTIDDNYDGKGVTRCVANRLEDNKVVNFEKCQRISTLTVVQEYITRKSLGFKLEKSDFPDNFANGFYLLGMCTNNVCANLNQDIWMHLGKGTFHIDEKMCTTKCKNCTQEVKVKDAGVHDEIFEIEGQVLNPKQARLYKKSVALRGKIKSIGQEEKFTWGYLKFIVGKV